MMKRVSIAAALLLATSGAVFAVDCETSGPVGQQQSFNTNDLSTTPLTVDSSVPTISANCTITDALPEGTAGRFVVYKVDMRPEFIDLNDDGTAVIVLTYTGEGVTKTLEFREGTPEFATITQKYAALDPANGFNGSYTMEITDGEGAAFLDEIILTMGWTTMSEQKDSFNQIGQQQLGLVTHLDGMSTLLTGGNLSLEGADEVAVMGGFGSYMVGVTGRMNLADGFSLLGGVSLVDFAMPGAGASGINGALAVRYVEPAGSAMRMFGEAGAQVGALNMNLSRSYYDSLTFSDDYDATSTGSGLLGAIYVRGGVLLEPMADNEVVISASLKQSALGLSDFTEADPDANPNFFVADLNGSTTTVTTIKTGVDWTTKLTDEVDLTASGHVGAAFGSGVSGEVFGVGTVTGDAQSTLFAQYGLRLGWELAPGSKIDGFVQGTTGTNIGTHAQVGAAYRLSF